MSATARCDLCSNDVPVTEDQRLAHHGWYPGGPICLHSGWRVPREQPVTTERTDHA